MCLKFNLINVFSDFSRWSVQNLKSEGTSLEIDLSSLHFFNGFNGYEITVCNGNLAPDAFSQKLDNGISFEWSHGDCRAGKRVWRCVAGIIRAWDFGLQDGGACKLFKKTVDYTL